MCIRLPALGVHSLGSVCIHAFKPQHQPPRPHRAWMRPEHPEPARHRHRALNQRAVLLCTCRADAGGTKLGDDKRVCYHNMQGIADYGRLGHAEVSRPIVPQPSPCFCKRKHLAIIMLLTASTSPTSPNECTTALSYLFPPFRSCLCELRSIDSMRLSSMVTRRNVLSGFLKPMHMTRATKPRPRSFHPSILAFWHRWYVD